MRPEAGTAGALVADLREWIDRLFPDAERGERLERALGERFGGAFAAPMYAARPGRTYPELIVRMAAGETIEPHVGDFQADVTFTRWYWQLELDQSLRPTGREMLEGSYRPPQVGPPGET